MVVVAALGLRLLLSFLVPPGGFGQILDEIAYTELLIWTADGGAWYEWRDGSGAKFWPGGFSFLAPAFLLHLLGIEALTSLRITSLAYGTGALILVYRLLVAPVHSGKWFSQNRISWWKAAALFLLAFFPSHLFWSVVGLRESTVEFFLVLTAWGTARYLGLHRYFRHRLLFLLSICTGLLGLAISRREMVVLVAFGLISAVLIHRKSIGQGTFVLVGVAVLIPMVGFTISLPKDLSSSERTKPAVAEMPIDQEQREQSSNRYDLQSPVTSIWTTREALRRGASVVPLSGCENARNYQGSVVCELARLPGALRLIFVAPSHDVWSPEVSALKRAAAVESLLWPGILLAGLLAVFFTRSIPNAGMRVLGTSMLATGGTFILALAATSGNLGTSFRHKSILLAILVLFVASRSARTTSMSPGKTI